MKLKADVTEEKLNGRYFTPQDIAEYVTNWVLNQEGNIDSILEPSVGDGIFLECLNGHLDVLQNTELIAVEIDEAVSRSASARNNQLRCGRIWVTNAKQLLMMIFMKYIKIF